MKRACELKDRMNQGNLLGLVFELSERGACIVLGNPYRDLCIETPTRSVLNMKRLRCM